MGEGKGDGAVAINGTNYDAIVIDEGQDFGSGWLLALLMMCSNPDESPVYVFMDDHQNLFTRSWSLPEEWPEVPLDVNCRNTAPIASKFARFYSDPVSTLCVDGLDPVFSEVKNDNRTVSLVQKIVERLIEEDKVAPDRIAVLSDSREIVRQLHEMLVLDIPFSPFERTGLTAETIMRFKGLESDVIVLALSSEILKDPDRLKHLGYVGMSRAKTILYVVATKNVREAIGWDQLISR